MHIKVFKFKINVISLLDVFYFSLLAVYFFIIASYLLRLLVAAS